MHINRHYGPTEADTRQSLLDLVEWFGWKKALLVFRFVKACRTMRDLDDANMAVGFGGVSGRPVLDLFRRFHGHDAVERWRQVTRWTDDTPIKEV